jgi:hypothetical protein
MRIQPTSSNLSIINFTIGLRNFAYSTIFAQFSAVVPFHLASIGSELETKSLVGDLSLIMIVECSLRTLYTQRHAGIETLLLFSQMIQEQLMGFKFPPTRTQTPFNVTINAINLLII